MTAKAGSILSVTIRGKIYSVPADNDAAVDLGGMSAQHLPNGDGTTRVEQVRRPWKIGGLELSIDHVNQDLQHLKDNMNTGENVPITITMAGDVTYGGQGTVTGDALELSTASSTVEVDLAGPGELELQ